MADNIGAWQITFGRKNAFSQLSCYTVCFVFRNCGRPLIIVYCIYSQISGPVGKEMVPGKINKSVEYHYPLWAWQITDRGNPAKPTVNRNRWAGILPPPLYSADNRKFIPVDAVDVATTHMCRVPKQVRNGITNVPILSPW